MPSLASLLIDNPGSAPGARRPAPVRSGFAPHRAPAPARRLSEADLKLKIRASRGRPLSLDEQETLLLAKIIERSEADPFGGRVAPSSFLTTSDLSNLHLRTPGEDGGTDDPASEEQPGSDGGVGRPAASGANPAGSLIPIEQSVIAPNATPHAEEEIPASVLVALDVLQSGGREQPVPPQAAPVRAPSAPPAAAPQPEIPVESRRQKPTEAALGLAFNIMSGGPVATFRQPAPALQEGGRPVPKGQHLDAKDWEQTMLEARNRKRGPASAEPRQRRSISEHADRPSKPGESSEAAEARRRADAAVSRL